MGRTAKLDVNADESTTYFDLLAAMKLAEHRDRIARQYCDSFADLLCNVVPVVAGAISRRGDVLGGIAEAHLRLLASEQDSLIARKHGPEVACRVQTLAQEINPSDHAQCQRFDKTLREDHPGLPGRCNPGTTADLIAASLYILLRSKTATGETE